jgi:hypothetical protein
VRALPPLLLAVVSILGADSVRADGDGEPLAHSFAQCAAQIAPKTRSGLDQLESCPRLEQIIEGSGLGVQLDENWKTSLNREGLQDLAWLLQRYETRPVSAGPDIASLPNIAAGLSITANVGQSWWERVREWLRELLTPKGRSDSSWLDRLWPKFTVPRLLQHILFYSCVALILGMAGWIIWREIKAAGRGASGPRGFAWMGTRHPEQDARHEVSVADVDSTSPRDRPAMMLRLLVQALVRSGRLRGESSLTHNELARRGRFENSDQQQRFLRVSRLAEKLLYGKEGSDGAAVPSSEIDQTVSDGRQLYEQLCATTATAA